ncbi:uncharacterized protein PG986_005081 [Apiospora aurea]|uniref:Clr5 domain-containing protein n=1 Tax=Apiospora aurea TaxID=335848 RepID=A0ABR1QGX6_9PEZI
MSDISIIQYAKEPVRLHSARIPRALWEEKKPQIAKLYESLTLDGVIEQMAETGFTASRRQYVYQLELWGITKYKVHEGKTSESDDAPVSKRKHPVEGVAHGDDQQRGTSSPSSIMPSTKRPRVTVEWGIGPDEELVETPATDSLERPVATTGDDKPAKCHKSSYSASHPGYLTTFFHKDPATEFWEFMNSSKPRWSVGRENDKMAREASWLAKTARSEPPGKRPWTRSELIDIRLYLQDIGEYLCGNKRGGEAFEFYALALEELADYPRGVDKMTLLSCVRSVRSPMDCQWVASFLQSYEMDPEASSDSWDVFILVNLVLALKLSAYMMDVEAKQHATKALRLREETCLLRANSSKTRWGILNSVQDFYFSEIQREHDLVDETYWEGKENPWRQVTWTYSRLASDLDVLRSELLSLSKIIMECVQGPPRSWVIGEDNKQAAGLFPYSTIFFQVLWCTRFDESQRPLSILAENVVNARRGLSTPLPDFVGTCCGMLAHRVIGHLQAKGTCNVPTWRRSLQNIDLVSIVSRMEASELHSDFVKCYYGRDAGCRAVRMADWSYLRDHDYYNLPSELINEISAEEPMSLSDEDPGEEFNNISASSTSSVEPAQKEYTDDDTHSSTPMAVPSSFQPCSIPRGSVENYYLDPTLGSPCHSSLASYGRMIEARAAMARGRKQAKKNSPAKGMGTGEACHRRCLRWRS